MAVDPQQPNSVTMMLTADPLPERVTIRIIDSKNDAILATMKDISVNLAL